MLPIKTDEFVKGIFYFKCINCGETIELESLGQNEKPEDNGSLHIQILPSIVNYLNGYIPSTRLALPSIAHRCAIGEDGVIVGVAEFQRAIIKKEVIKKIMTVLK